MMILKRSIQILNISCNYENLQLIKHLLLIKIISKNWRSSHTSLFNNLEFNVLLDKGDFNNKRKLN